MDIPELPEDHVGGRDRPCMMHGTRRCVTSCRSRLAIWWHHLDGVSPIEVGSRSDGTTSTSARAANAHRTKICFVNSARFQLTQWNALTWSALSSTCTSPISGSTLSIGLVFQHGVAFVVQIESRSSYFSLLLLGKGDNIYTCQ